MIAKSDIIDVLTREGIELKKKGRSFSALCPFHSERTPSFKVFPEKQKFYCYGCGEGGDVIDFIKKHKGMDFGDAKDYLGINPINPSPKAFQEAKKQKRKRELIKKFNNWCRWYADAVHSIYQDIQDAKAMVKTEKDAEAIADLYHMENTVMDESRIMDSNNDRAKLELYREVEDEN